MAGLIIPQPAVAATRADVPSVRIVLPPATVRTALPPGAAVSRPAASPAPKPKPAQPAHEVATKVLTTTPLPGATNIAVGQRITIKLSAPPAKGAPMPTLVPPVAGKWWVNGKTLTFVVAAGYGPWTTEHVIVKSPLAAPDQWTFTVAPVSALRVQELLAELGYLPVNVDVSKGKPLLSEEPTRGRAGLEHRSARRLHVALPIVAAIHEITVVGGPVHGHDPGCCDELRRDRGPALRRRPRPAAYGPP